VIDFCVNSIWDFFNNPGVLSVLKWVAYVAMSVVGFFAFVFGGFALLNKWSSQQHPAFVRSWLPLILGIATAGGAAWLLFDNGGHLWMFAATGVAFLFLCMGVGLVGWGFSIPVALVGLSLWYFWPAPWHYVVAVQSVAREQIASYWNNYIVGSPKSEIESQTSTLSPEFTEKLRQGLAAAKSGNWPLAIQHLRSAHEFDPSRPEALMNLALAHDKAGHSIMALCWYNAFLAIAPDGPSKAAVVLRIAALNEELRTGLGKLTNAARDVSAAQANGVQIGDLHTISMVEAEFGDVTAALATLETIRQLDPNDNYWSGNCLLVGDSFARQGLFEPAELLGGRFKSAYSVMLRTRVSVERQRVGALTNASSNWPNQGPEAVKLWAEYADLIPSSGHHRWHAFDVVSLDLRSFPPNPAPEMGISEYLAGLQQRQELSPYALLDGIKRLFLTRREIHRRSNPLPPSIQISPGNKPPTLSEIVESQQRLLDQIKASSSPGTFPQ
jgi:tetratricopeptide (TPR) repeat protein